MVGRGIRRIVLPGEPLLDGTTALRPWRDSDIPALVAACQDPEIARWTRVPSPYGESDARAYMLHRHDAIHTGAAAPFAIVGGKQPDDSRAAQPDDSRAAQLGEAGSRVGGRREGEAGSRAGGKPEGQLLGSVSLMRPAWEHARAEVGYWLARDARGEGHATRALALICAWGFRALGLARIELLAATGNLASQRVAQRAGFTREAVLRSYMRGPQGRHDMVCFGLLAGERR